MSHSLYQITVKNSQGQDISLADYQNKVLLIVNVASKCGLTPQYEGLQQLYENYKDQGLEILAFPANDFKQQEPGSDAEIQAFCQTNYGVSFPVLAKISVLGEAQHPLYQYLTEAYPERGGADFAERLQGFGIDVSSPPNILWNFEKFIINKQGDVVARFAPNVPADQPELINIIQRELAL